MAAERDELYGVVPVLFGEPEDGHQLIGRYESSGLEALRGQSRAPKQQAREVLPEVAQSVIAARPAHPTWGAVKLRAVLQREAPEIQWPVASTIGDILKRQGLTVRRVKRVRATPNARLLAHALAPKDVWCADFKGWFRTQDGAHCDPLTFSDAYSRYLLRCQVVGRTDFEHVHGVFEAAFREFGPPVALRTDNGPPFASTALGWLSRLGIWLVRLGIRPERIRPGRPQENGRHDRLHRTLKQKTAQPAQASLRAQQKAFDRFRREYTYVPGRTQRRATTRCAPAADTGLAVRSLEPLLPAAAGGARGS